MFRDREGENKMTAPKIEGYIEIAETEWSRLPDWDRGITRFEDIYFYYRKIPEPEKTNEELAREITMKDFNWGCENSITRLLQVVDEKNKRLEERLRTEIKKAVGG
jgi:hypothetical protein